MQSIFNIISIVGDFSNKSITIETNFPVDSTTVNKKNIKVINASSDTIVVYKLSVDDNKIIITLKEWPVIGEKYQVTISSDLKDMLNRTLATPLAKIVQFNSETKYKADIIYPNNNEAIISKNNIVYFAIRRVNPDGSYFSSPNTNLIKPDYMNDIKTNNNKTEAIEEVDFNIKYHFEFASDIAFFDVIKDYTSEYTDGTIELEDGQYYMRTRVIENDMTSDWSDIITFSIVSDIADSKDKILSEAQQNYLDEIFAPVDFFLDEEEELIIVSKSPNGETPSEYYIEFNLDIDKDKLPKQLIAYRRDL